MIDRRAFLRASLYVAASATFVSLWAKDRGYPNFSGYGKQWTELDTETGNRITYWEWSNGRVSAGLGFVTPRSHPEWFTNQCALLKRAAEQAMKHGSIGA